MRSCPLCASAGSTVAFVLDTHPHADHFSAAHYLAQKLGARQGIGRRVLDVQRLWADLYAQDDMQDQPDHWDRLFDDGDTFAIGGLQAQVILSTGHTRWRRSATGSAMRSSRMTR